MTHTHTSTHHLPYSPQAEVLEEEAAATPTWSRNAKLGRFTNFVNLLDMCGIALPSGLVSYDAAVLAEVRRVWGRGTECNQRMQRHGARGIRSQGALRTASQHLHRLAPLLPHTATVR